MTGNKKVLITVGSRANFGRLETLIDALSENQSVDIEILLHASALSERYGLSPISLKKLSAFKLHKFHSLLDSDDSVGAAKTISSSMTSVADLLININPDCIVVGGDRYEILAPAITSVIFSIPLIHLQGGEVTGNFDNKIRYCISQLADYHFPSNKYAQENLLKLGISESRIFNTGCPGLDSITLSNSTLTTEFFNSKGSGRHFQNIDNYGVVIYHPQTLITKDEISVFDNIFKALSNLQIKNIVVFWPNADPGNNKLSKRLREILESNEYKDLTIRAYKSFTPDEYNLVLNSCKLAIGNSSSLIREGSFLGVPALLIGSRQKNRILGGNVITSENCEFAILDNATKLVHRERPSPSKLYGDGSAGRKIAKIIVSTELSVTGV